MKLLAAALSIVVVGVATDVRPVAGPADGPATDGSEWGRCMVITTRGASPEPDWASQLCDVGTSASHASIGSRYAWLPEYLNRAVDDGERVTCGAPGCALHDRTVRFYVVANDVPVVASRREDARISILLTTGAVDVVDRAAAVSDGRLAAWLSQVDRGAGTHCGHVAVTTREPAVEKQGRAAATSFYELLVANEIARLRLGPQCGEGEHTDTRSRDVACQSAAWSYVDRRLAPAPVAAASLALAHVESLDRYAWAVSASDEPVLGAVGRLGPSAWSRRAAMVVERWAKASADGRAAEVPADLRAALALPMPAACPAPASTLTRSLGRPVTDDPSALACLERVPSTDWPVVWDTDGDPILVRVDLTYRDTCTRAIRCRLTTSIGTSPADEVETHDWLTLRPGTTGRITRVLSWPVTGVPYVRFARGAEESDLATCEPL